MRKHFAILLTVSGALMWLTTVASAQVPEPGQETSVQKQRVPTLTEPIDETATDEKPAENATATDAAADPDTQTSANADLEDSVSLLKQQIQELKREFKQYKEDQEATNIALSAEQSSSTMEAERLKIYGFFDLSFGKWLLPDDARTMTYFAQNESSFAISNINLYVQSKMTRNLSALVELHYSFLPQGLWKTRPTALVLPNGTQMPATGEFTRYDSDYYELWSTANRTTASVEIERVHLTYDYRQWLELVVGRFLTPYGIWNIDHGSPVVLLTRLPFMISYRHLPGAQTGLQVKGRVFPVSTFALDYAFTLSNGRGPMDSFQDLDENKAVGFRLKGTFESGDLSASAGTYMYYGTYADRDETNVIDLADTTARVQRTKTASYDELAISADLLIRYKGLRLQCEYVFRKTMMNVPAPEDEYNQITKGLTNIEGTFARPNYITWDGYGMLAYELPWKILGTRITPVLFAEYTRLDDTRGGGALELIGTLNIRPSPYLVIKLEYTHVKIYMKDAKDDYGNQLIAQTAVSF